MKIDLPKESGIYCFENIINNKKYIGQAIDLQNRTTYHRNALRRNKDACTYLQNSWNVYGEESFIIYIVEKCSIEDLDDKEIFFIKELHSHVSEGGLNISWGGDSFMRGRKHTEESKKKISENSAVPSGELNRQFGVPRTDEEKKKISEGLLKYYETHDDPKLGIKQSPEFIAKRIAGRINWEISQETRDKISASNKGRKTSEEAKEKMSKARKGIPLAEETKKKMSLAKIGKPSNSKGKKQSNETIENRSNKIAGMKKTGNSSSTYVGVSFDKTYKKWSAYINYKGKRFNLGKFITEIDAALAYNAKAIELYGENAKLNIIEEEDNE